MATIDEIRNTRLKKLKAIEAAGNLAYPVFSKRTQTIGEVLDNFSKIKKTIVLAGRLMSLRGHGGLVFGNIQDATGKIQAMFKKDKLGDKEFQFFADNFDVGDFVELKGSLIKTRTKEKTLLADSCRMLAKSLLPLPEKWHGLQDIEERFRKRYLDLIFNKEVKERFLIRSEIIKELRNILEQEGFLEVETPILQPIYGGASARPFKTHLNAQNLDLYLRISPELYLKRLLVAGFEKVYEIGKCFRNEGIDKAHNPDFTMLEFYWAYANHEDLMKFTEKIISSLLKKLFGKTQIEYKNKKLNFKSPLPRIDYEALFKKYTGKEMPKNSNFETIDEIFKKEIRPKIEQPIFVINYPGSAFPLAKPLDSNPTKSASFQFIAAGMEIVKAYSELNNPILQKQKFQDQEKIFKAGFEEAQRMDEDYIEALEYGMPPAAGWGLGIDRLVMLLTNSHSAREIILFPTMKSK